MFGKGEKKASSNTICLNPDSWIFLPTEDWLLVGTKPGHLLLYRIKKDAGRKSQTDVWCNWFLVYLRTFSTYCCLIQIKVWVIFNVSLFTLGTNRFEVTLEKSNKNFSKKIQQVDKTNFCINQKLCSATHCIVPGLSDSKHKLHFTLNSALNCQCSTPSLEINLGVTSICQLNAKRGWYDQVAQINLQIEQFS